jgi:BioD-like phosphotransacetylase family protein
MFNGLKVQRLGGSERPCFPRPRQRLQNSCLRSIPLKSGKAALVTNPPQSVTRRLDSYVGFLFIGTTGDHAGHSLVTWAITRRLLERGFRVGLLKPFGTQRVNINGHWSDPDALLFKETLDIQEPLERICPYLISDEAWRDRGSETLHEEIRTLARELSDNKDVLIIMGADHIFLDNASRGISDISLAGELEADFVLVDRYRDTSKSIYSILSASSLLGDRLKGIVLNRVPLASIQEIRSRIIPALSSRGVPLTIAIPEDPYLSFQMIGDVRDALNGEFLCGEANVDQPVGGMTVGSSDLEGDLLIFKRAYNKIILLEPHPQERESDSPQGPRPIAGILLSGGRPPAPQLLAAAKKAGVALILVKGDTFSVLERLGQSPPPLSPHDHAKVRRLTELMDRDDALDRLLQGTGAFPK